MRPDTCREWALPAHYDFFETTRMLRIGGADPTLRRTPDGMWRSAHTPDGPATVRLAVGDSLQGQAWGPGAARALEDVPRWIGLDEPPWRLPSHPVTDRLLAQHPGLRGTDTRDVFEALTGVVLQQLVTWREAATCWRRLCEALGQPAPGPAGLRLSATPEAVRAAGADRLRAFGIGFKRARTLIEIARVAHALRRVADLPTEQALPLLMQVRGVGVWTASCALGMRFARPEPVPVGDLHLPNTVAWVLAGEPRGTDARMLELLRPFDGHAFRVVRLLFAAHVEAPRHGPGRGRPARHRFVSPS